MRIHFEQANGGEHALDECALGQLATRDVDMHAEATVDDTRVEPRTRVAACLRDHPLADRHDDARLFRDVHELGGQHCAALGVIPAQHCFGTSHSTAMRRDDRLIGKAQLPGGHCPFQIAREFFLVARLGAHGIGVQLAARAAAALGLIHGDVGVAQQFVGRIVAADALHVLRSGDGDAGADGKLDFHAVHHDATAETESNAFGKVDCGVLVDVAVAQHDELVAADSCNDVGRASGLRNSVRDLR